VIKVSGGGERVFNLVSQKSKIKFKKLIENKIRLTEDTRTK